MQTAVIGSAKSEIPVMLPMQAIEVRSFRNAHEGETFWCGRWLGGCGGRLTSKLYADRACHFAHVPDPGRASAPCRRASVGVSSADHLYIKRQILQWLAAQSIPAHARISEDSDRLGGEVLFEPGGYGCLRVLLDQDAALPAAVDGTQLLLGPGVELDPHQLTLHGYVLRIRCDTDGTLRHVMIGTQMHGKTVWFSLDECQLMPWGLSTPAVEEVRRLRSTHRPLTIPHRPSPADHPAPVAAPQAEDDRESAFADLQQAVDHDHGGSELRHCLTRAETVTHGGASAEENALLRRAGDLMLRKERGVGLSTPPAPAITQHRASRAARRVSPTPAAAAATVKRGSRQAAKAAADLLDALDRRRDHLTPAEQQRLVTLLAEKAQKAGRWLTAEQGAKVTAWKDQASRTPAEADHPKPVRVPKAAAAGAHAAPITVPTDIDTVADAARDVLEHAARLGKTVTWNHLCAQVKGLAELPEDRQDRALQKASSRSRPSVPLAALITTDSGTLHPHYRRLTQQAGRPLPDDNAAARTAWQAAVTDVHRSYQPPR
ncbi:competence protein CoiA family protein [Streptomyces flavidovirens]|uniref:Competence protein CoiA family protein n=1 Tax=Streptomyces flavidovirens TaxID=67298 RepID=A0ABW6RA43_9ACTN